MYTTYLSNKILDHVFKVASFTQPTNLYMALSTSTPAQDGSGVTEPSGNGYARVQCNSSWATASGRANANSTAIEFPSATGSWGTITHVCLYDASTSGNLLLFITLTTPRDVGEGNGPKFAAGEFDNSLDA